MNTSKVYKELQSHLVATIQDHVGYDIYLEELHQVTFNNDWYIIGTFNASKSLKEWDIGEFEMIEFVQEYETNNFGEINTPIDLERMVNMLVYIVGEEVIQDLFSNLDLDTEDLINQPIVDEITTHLKKFI